MSPRRLLPLACALFLVSGAAGLAYEVIWFKRLAHVWGSSALAAASVLASYLLGLGIGAGVLGRKADGARSPLAWYGGCEVGIGLLALLVPFGIRGLEMAAAALYPLLEGRPLAGSLARAGLSLLVLGPPCFLMGGTFPLLVKQLTPEGGTLREATGILYAANTLGGAAGAYAAGFHLLPALGVAATNAAAAAVNLAAGAAALAAARFAGGPIAQPAVRPRPALAPGELPAAPPGEPCRRGIVLQAALLSGCASLALQVAWTRQLSLVLGGSTYAFTAMLAVVLAGIGLGSLAFHLWLRRARDLRRLQGAVTLVLLASVLGGQRLLEALALLSGAVRDLRSDPWWNASACALAASVLELLPAACMGVLLPLYAAAASRGSSDAGRTAGDVYAWNTAGTLIGALGGALVALPLWGAAATVAAALGVYLLAALLLFPAQGLRGKLGLAALAVLGAGAALFAARGPDPVLTNLGLYLYGGSRDSVRHVTPLYFAEGASANVLVVEHPDDGKRSLRVNGKVDASDSRDMPTQLGLAYFPRFFRPEAREVLVIGYGSGTTSGASLLFPGARVVCVEIEPAVVEAAEHFRHANHRPLESSRFRVVFDDGRSHVQGTRARYDLILSEPSNPWMAGVSSLFTRELYLAAKERLAEGGVLAQWLQAYSLTPSDYAMVVRTVRETFPHGALLVLPGTDTLLLASERPLEPDGPALDRVQALVDSLPAVRADLEAHFGGRDVRSVLLRHWVLGDDGLAALLAKDGGGLVNTDLNLRLELDAPLRLFDEAVDAGRVKRGLLAATDAAAISQRWDRWGCGAAQLPALRGLLDLFAAFDAWDAARGLLDFCLRRTPEDPYFLAARFMSSPPEDPKAWNEGFAQVLALSREEAARIAVWLHMSKDLEGAVKAWRRILEAHPQAATAWVHLASSLEAKGEAEEVRVALEKARELDPFSAFVRARADEASGRPAVSPAASAASER